MGTSERRSTAQLFRAVALVVLLGLPVAGLTPNPASSQADLSRGAHRATSIEDDPRCGGRGFTSVAIAGRDTFSCFHSAPDPMPTIAGPLAEAKTAAPVCLGNGVNGPRIQLIYMYVEGEPDRSAALIPRILNEFVPRMEGVFRSTSREQGREIGLRLYMPDCQLKVDTVMIDADNGAPDEPGPMVMRIASRLVAEGYDSPERKYLVWFDGGSRGACGAAPVEIGWPTGGDHPLPTNDNNQGRQSRDDPEAAVTFRYGAPILGGNPRNLNGCWGNGGTGARTEIHELIHLLGAVNFSAPNSNGFGHCTDDHDIMCYGERGVSTVPRCAAAVEQLDCGSDDYFNARPAVGSYLSTHWNTANSKFLGDAIVDAVPAEVPRL